MNNSIIFQWWIVIFGIGLIFLPLTFTIFKNFFDRGYIFSKILGIVVASYAVFLLGVLHIAPFSSLTSALILIFFAVLNFAFIIRKKNDGLKSFLKILKENWQIFIFEEILFILCLLSWSYVRSFQPDIHGLEKYMDFGILNSILRSEFFPPKDMWFTPLPINYYYFGHLTTAILTKLSNIPSNITFNLMIASIFAFTFVGSFSIGANLIRILKSQITNHKSQINNNAQNPKNSKVLNFRNWRLFGVWNFEFGALIGGFLTAFLVSFAGNLQTIYAFFKNYSGDNPVPFWHLPFSLSTFPNNYWYPNATRFIHNTIHEFPLYSFVVSDLHGHVLDIPFVLLTIALLLSLITKSQITNLPAGKAGHKSQINSKNKNIKNSKVLNFGDWRLFGVWNFEFEILLLAFLLAVTYMTNAWDGIIYFLLAALVLFFFSKKLSIGSWFLTVAILFFGFFIFSYPFNHFFKPFVSGIGIICPPEFLVKIGKLGPFILEEAHCQKSPLWQIMILYGFFYFWVISFFFSILKKKNPKSETLNPKQIRNHNNQGYKRFGILNFGNWGLFRNLKLEIRDLATSDIFVLLLILLSTILIIIPELIYVKDIYPAHYRANTMFKLVYQSFIMLSISSGYIIVRVFSHYKSKVNSSNQGFNFLSFKNWKLFGIWTLGFGAFALVSIYPYFAINSFYGGLKAQLGLDGTKYLKNLYPTDYDAIAWINKNIKGQPVILEAQGDSYTDFARVSANTGLPTVLGWTVHEWLWRGTYDVPAPRIPQVQTLYESSDVNITRNLIERYKIEYVFIGDLEYQKYTKLAEQKFGNLGKIIYKNGKTKIYKITL